MSPRPILIGVCAFRRPTLERTLLSLAAQRTPPGARVRLAVADNDDSPSALAQVSAVAARTGVPIEHRHVPARNIALARNALLDAALEAAADGGEAGDGRPALLAFLDDDEWVEADWLSRLLEAMDAAGADAVMGPVRGVHAAGAPAWIRQGGFHDAEPEVDRAGRVRQGHSGNALVNLAAPPFRGRRFDLALGRTGGEDTAFFEGARRAGAVLAAAPLAVAWEHVPPLRATAAWLARRRFRMGQTHAALIGEGAGPARRLGLAALAGAKGVACLALAAAQAPLPARRNRALLRGCLHAGAASSLLGARTLVLYGSPEAGLPPSGPLPSDPAAGA